MSGQGKRQNNRGKNHLGSWTNGCDDCFSVPVIKKVLWNKIWVVTIRAVVGTGYSESRKAFLEIVRFQGRNEKGIKRKKNRKTESRIYIFYGQLHYPSSMLLLKFPLGL